MANAKQNLTPVFAAGTAVGALGAFFIQKWFLREQPLHADVILEKVRTAFLEEGPIEGAWIEFEKIPVQTFAIKTKTYRGGITRQEDDALVQYTFVADAYTGSILEIERNETI